MSWADDFYEKAKEQAELLHPIINKNYVNSLLSRYLRREGEEKEELRDRIKRIIDRGFLETQNWKVKKPLLPIPDEPVSKGEITIGKVMHGPNTWHAFGISQEELNRHFLITAQSGAGKTTLIINMIRELLRLRIPFLITDFKRDYRHLIRKFPEILVVNWKDLRVNPFLPPPGVEWREWKQQILAIFGHVERVWMGSTSFLLEVIDQVYERLRTGTRMDSILDELNARRRSGKDKMGDYWATVYVRLYATNSKLGETINSSDVMSIEKMLDYPTVLEFDGLDRETATFLILCFYYWIYTYRKAQHHRGRLRHVLVIDEAKRVFTAAEMFSQTTAELSGNPPADTVVAEIRDYGEAIIASDQEPTKLSKSLKANTYVKMTGNLGDGEDIRNISASMNLDDKEQDAISALDKGEWLVKLSGRYSEAFMLKTEDFLLVKDVTDEEVKKISGPTLEKLIAVGGQYKLETPVERPEAGLEGVPEIALSADAWALLKHANELPFMGIRARAKMLGISQRKLYAGRDELEKRGMLNPVSIKQGAYAPKVLLEITTDGKKVLEKNGAAVNKDWERVGRVGIEHAYWQYRVAAAYKQKGYGCMIEAGLGKKRRVDVLLWGKEKWAGVEIELNPNNQMVEKFNEMGPMNFVLVLTRTTDDVIKIEEQVNSSESREKIKVMTFERWLKEVGYEEVETKGEQDDEKETGTN